MDPGKEHQHAERRRVISLFRDHLGRSPGLIKEIPSLAGKQLVCHCKSGEECHCDVLIEEFERISNGNVEDELRIATLLNTW